MDLRKYLGEPIDKKEVLKGSVSGRNVFGRTKITTSRGEYHALDMRGTGSDNVLVVNVGQKQNRFSSIIGGEEQMITPLERREIPPLAKNYPWLRWEDQDYQASNGGTIEIATAQDLNNVRNNLSGSFIQTADIDLSGFANWDPIGSLLDPFVGIYNGNGYRIIGLNIDTTNSRVGLFGCALFGGWAGSNGYFKNMNIINANVKGGSSVGILVGEFWWGNIIENCFVSGVIQASSDAGGLIGYGYRTDNKGGIYAVRRCIGNVNVKITGSYAGSLVGRFTCSDDTGIDFYQCGSSGKVESNYYSGGLIGYTERNIIGQCFSRSDIEAKESGGLVGSISRGEINNCYTWGKIIGENSGGLLGYVSSNIPIVENCYVLYGSLQGMGPGNIDFINCYQNKDLSEIDDEHGRTTKEMKTQATYQGWDFNNIWRI